MLDYKFGFDYGNRVFVHSGPFAGYEGSVVGCGNDCLLLTLDGRDNIALVQYIDVKKKG